MSRRKLVRTAALIPLAFALAATGAQAAYSVSGKDGPRKGGPRSATTETTTTSPAAATTTTTTPPPVTTTTATAPTGSVTFAGDFETGNASQWTWGAQCANYGIGGGGRGNLYLDGSTVGQGKYSGRFELPSYGSGTRACEVLAKRTPGLGTTDVYGQMIYLPSNWRTATSDVGFGVIAFQPNYESVASPGISLWLRQTGAQLVMVTGHVVWSGTPGASTPVYQYNNSTQLGAWPNAPRAIPDGQLQTGVWHELVYEIHWATDSTGYVKVWHRVKGQLSWTQTLDIENVPTFQWGYTESGGYVTAAGTNADGSTYTTCDKVGAYTSAGASAITLWQDGFVRGTTFDAVAGRMP
jgi:hypothetical protein